MSSEPLELVVAALLVGQKLEVAAVAGPVAVELHFLCFSVGVFAHRRE